MNSKDFLQQNLNLLGKRHPDTARKIGAAGNLPPGMLFFTEEGFPNLRVSLPDGSIRALFKGNRPEMSIGRDAASGMYGADRATVMLGFGVGLLASEAVKHMDPGHAFLIVELDPAILKAAFTYSDFTGLLSHPEIHWVLSQAELEDGFRFLYEHMPTKVNCVFRPMYLEALPEAYEPLRLKILDVLDTVTGSAAFVDTQGVLSTRNSLKNLVHRVTQHGVAKLFNRFRNVPAILAAGGPSLEKNLHLLRGVEERAVIICSDSAVRPALALGIRPHFITAIDPTPANLKKFEGVPIPSEIALVCAPSVQYKIPARYPGPILFHHRGPQDLMWNERLIGEEGLLQSVSSVALLSLHLALAMGCDPVILVGQDLAFTGEKAHASGQDTWTINDARQLGMTFTRDMWGDEVRTVKQFQGVARLFEREAAHNERRFINATEGGLLLEGYRPMLLKHALEAFCSTPRPEVRDAWWNHPTAGWDRGQALAGLTGQVKERAERLTRLIRLCRDVVSASGKKKKGGKARNTALKVLTDALPSLASTLLLCSSASTPLFRWIHRDNPVELAARLSRDMRMASEFCRIVGEVGPEIREGLDAVHTTLELLLSVEREAATRSASELVDRARELAELELFNPALFLLSRAVEEGREEARSPWARVLLELGRFDMVLNGSGLGSASGLDEEADNPVRLARERGAAWDAVVADVREKYHAGPDRDARAVLLEDIRFYSRTKDLNLAGRLLDQYARKFGQDSDAWCLRGENLSEAGKWAEAVPALHRSIALDKSNGRAWAALGKAAVQLGRKEDAESAFLTAREAGYAGSDLIEALSDLYVQWNRLDEALEVLEDGASRFPRSGFIREKLDSCRRLASRP